MENLIIGIWFGTFISLIAYLIKRKKKKSTIKPDDIVDPGNYKELTRAIQEHNMLQKHGAQARMITHERENARFITEWKRLQNEELIIPCYVRNPKATEELRHIHTETISSQHAFMYLHILIKAKANPDMTLKEYFELE